MRPREQLQGMRLPGGWTVQRLLSKKSGTGGNFSVGYIVVHDDGHEAFLKAMDYLEAFNYPNTAEMLKFFAEMYLFEKNICEACRDHQLRRVVHAIESGSVQTDKSNPVSKVEYLIFELADGDVRYHLDNHAAFDVAFMLRALHGAATGLEQMHRAEMAHQDLKPSNLLIMHGDNGAKIADLGRAWAKAFPAPHDHMPVAGDSTYAPPELLYPDPPTDSRMRRFGCDLFTFGNLTAFVFTRANVNALMYGHLDKAHWPLAWGGTYRDVLPYVRTGFGAALAQIETEMPDFPKQELVVMIRELCEPDPALRGHPRNRIGHQNQFCLDRYISTLDTLATKAELRLAGAK